MYGTTASAMRTSAPRMTPTAPTVPAAAALDLDQPRARMFWMYGEIAAATRMDTMTETVVVERATAIATRKAPSARLTRMRQPIAPSQRSQSGARSCWPASGSRRVASTRAS